MRLARFFDRDLRQVLGQSTWIYASSAFIMGLQLVETLLMARILSLQEFGLFILATSYPELVQQVLDFRTREAMTKYLSEFLVRAEKKRAVALIKFLWAIDVSVNLVAYAIVLITSSLVATFLLQAPELALLMQVYGLGLLLSSLDGAAGSIMRVYDRFDLSFWTAMLAALLRFGLVIWALLSGGGILLVVEARVVAELGLTLIMGTAALLLFRQKLWTERDAPMRALGSDYFRQVRGFLFHTNLAGTLKLVVSKIDVFVLAIFWSASVVALYKMAVRLGTILITVSDPLYATLLPNFAKMYTSGGLQAVYHMGRRISFLLAGLMLPVAAIVILFAEPLIKIAAGSEFISATWPFVLIFVGVLLYSIFFWLRPAILGMGRADILFKIGLIAAVVQMMILITLAPTLGALGGAIAVAAYYLVYVVFELLFVRAHLKAPISNDVHTDGVSAA